MTQGERKITQENSYLLKNDFVCEFNRLHYLLFKAYNSNRNLHISYIKREKKG